MFYKLLKDLLMEVFNITLTAGKEVLKIYNSAYDVIFKYDNSPLTEADKKSHNIIVSGLQNLNTGFEIPVLSEEGKNISFGERKKWEMFWLVDPLDGTKEFIKKNGEFTINIALIKRQEPVFGVVYAPCLDLLYFGVKDLGSFKIENATLVLNTKKISEDIFTRRLPLFNRSLKGKEVVVAVSRSHMNERTERFLYDLKRLGCNLKTISKGSSLKICLVAEGIVDLYPRLAPTMEWDTAAAHAVCLYAGKNIYEYKESFFENKDNLKPLTYNKAELVNPPFVAVGRFPF